MIKYDGHFYEASRGWLMMRKSLVAKNDFSLNGFFYYGAKY